MIWQRILKGYTALKWLLYLLKAVAARKSPWYVMLLALSGIPILISIANMLSRKTKQIVL